MVHTLVGVLISAAAERGINGDEVTLMVMQEVLILRERIMTLREEFEPLLLSPRGYSNSAKSVRSIGISTEKAAHGQAEELITQEVD